MTIAEVCKEFNISADTLRYYEKVGLLPAIGRTSGGIRNYTEYDCGWVEFIKCMRSAGVQVESLVEYVCLFEKGEAAETRKQILETERTRLGEKIAKLQTAYDRLNMKIERYEKDIIPAERELMRTAN